MTLYSETSTFSGSLRDSGRPFDWTEEGVKPEFTEGQKWDPNSLCGASRDRSTEVRVACAEGTDLSVRDGATLEELRVV